MHLFWWVCLNSLVVRTMYRVGQKLGGSDTQNACVSLPPNFWPTLYLFQYQGLYETTNSPCLGFLLCWEKRSFDSVTISSRDDVHICSIHILSQGLSWEKVKKKFVPIFIQKLTIDVIHECVLYSNKYGHCHYRHFNHKHYNKFLYFFLLLI